MVIKKIPLSQLEKYPRGTLSACCDSGQSFVVELPDHRLVAIEALEPDEDDALTDELITQTERFCAVFAVGA